jgi:uncharacterized protein
MFIDPSTMYLLYRGIPRIILSPIPDCTGNLRKVLRSDGFTARSMSEGADGVTLPAAPLEMNMSASLGAHLTVATVLVAFAGVFLICFMKGAFGGGFSIVGIPLLSLVMDPVTAGGLLAPLFIAMDLYALRYWKPSTWSKQDLTLLLPGLVIGIGFGFLLFRFLDHRVIAIVMAASTLTFVGLWLIAGAEVAIRPRSTPKAITAGLASGITTMVAHSGGPPLAMYLLPLGLSKEIYAGTTSLFFTVGNLTKAVPWLLLVRPTSDVWTLMSICLLAIPGGVWLGWRLHGTLDQRQIYRVCYGLLVVTALKLLWDGVSGFLG